MNIISDISSDKRILHGLGRFTRQPKFMQSHNWTKMRIAFRMTIEDGGATLGNVGIPSQANFQLGVCSGTSPTFTNRFNTIIIGLNNSWIYATSPTRYTVNWFQVSATGGSSGSDSEPSTAITFCNPEARTVCFMDITKAGTSWSARWFRNTSATETDVSIDTFNSQVLLDTPTITNHSFSNSSTCTVDEATYGYMDHIWFAWSSITRIRISDLAAIRLL